jgi:hypothetical protein
MMKDAWMYNTNTDFPSISEHAKRWQEGRKYFEAARRFAVCGACKRLYVKQDQEFDSSTTKPSCLTMPEGAALAIG